MYLPLSSLVVVQRKLFSQVTSYNLEQALVLLGSIRGETHRCSAGYRLGVSMAVHALS